MSNRYKLVFLQLEMVDQLQAHTIGAIFAEFDIVVTISHAICIAFQTEIRIGKLSGLQRDIVFDYCARFVIQARTPAWEIDGYVFSLHSCQ